MFRVFVKVRLRDFEAFRTFFDREGGADERRAWGIERTQIHRTLSEPNEVTICHEFDNVEDAKAYKRRSRLVDVMVEAGATQAPEIWETEVVSA
jgi:hypothetical protein